MPGNEAEAIKTAGGIGANRIPGNANKASNQTSGAIVN